MRIANEEKVKKKLEDEKRKMEKEIRNKELYLEKKKVEEERAMKRSAYFNQKN